MVTALEQVNTFTEKNLPDLDVVVIAALEKLSKAKLPEIKVPYKHPLVVGSGNAAATGRIIFQDKDAVFADESTMKEKLKNIKSIDGVVLISASGGKHAPGLVDAAKHATGKKLPVTLITNNEHAEAINHLDKKRDKVLFFPKNREPYTYNTSTYLGPILAKTKEDPKKILKFLQEIDLTFTHNLWRYDNFYLIIPDEFEETKRLFQIKFIELFGRRIGRDIETRSYVRHATTVVPAKRELFISFGQTFTEFGKDHVTIPLPKDANAAAMMATAYYVIGKIQKAHPPYFKKNIRDYVKKVSEIFGETIEVIVE